jgi:hypothetical protein
MLRALLNPLVLSHCTAPRSSDSRYADATLRCTASGGMQVTAYHFPSDAALDKQIGAKATYFQDQGNCDDGKESEERWSSPQAPSGGVRLCYFYAEKFVTFWTYDEDRIAFLAQNPDPKGLARWWRAFDPVKH